MSRSTFKTAIIPYLSMFRYSVGLDFLDDLFLLTSQLSLFDI